MKNRRILIILVMILFGVSVYFGFRILSDKHYLEVYFLDVGQGDCEYIKTPKGSNVLIDGGGSNSQFEVGKNIVKPFLNKHNVFNINVAIVSHFHQDHAKGILELFDEMKIENLITPDIESNNIKPQLYFLLNEKSQQHHTLVTQMKSPQTFTLDNVNFLALLPNENVFINKSNNLNNDSLVLKMKYHNTSFLFTGDIEKDVEKAIENDPNLKSDVLKVAHHGSKTSTSEKILHTISPKYAVIEVGEHNLYFHPHREILKRLSEAIVQIYRTDLDGTVKFIVNQNGIVKIEKSRDTRTRSQI